MLDKARSYLGKTWIGTNSSDKGQCVGFYNKVVEDVSDILYPIKDAKNATQILTAKNTRPDLFDQIHNKTGLYPAPGDWVIWDNTWGNGDGHISCVESVNGSKGFVGIEQNFVPNTVTRQQHNWSHVIGWIHYKGGNEVSTVGDNEIDQMSWAYFGYGAGQDFIKEHRGTESNTFERFMFNHPVAVAYRAQVSEWRAKAEASQGKFIPVTEQLFKKY